MFSVHPGERTHELQLLSFQEAVSKLPKPMALKPEKTKKRKRADASLPLPSAADTNNNNKKNDLTASAFADCTVPYTKETSNHELVSKKNKTNGKRKQAASRPLSLAETKKNDLSTFAGVASVAAINKDSNIFELNNTAQTDIEDKTTHSLVSNKIMVPCSTTNTSTRTALERYNKVVKARQCEREREREAARNALLKIEEAAAAADGGDNYQLFKDMEELCGWPLPNDYAPPPSPSGTAPYLERRLSLKLIRSTDGVSNTFMSSTQG